MPVPAERDLPPGRLEVRATALVAAIDAEPARGRLRRWVGSLALLFASLAVVCVVVIAGSARPHETETAASAALVVAAGSGVGALVPAATPPQLPRPQPPAPPRS